MNIDKYDTIILDCDGVIFDSNFLKIEAFSSTFEELGFNKIHIDKFINFMKNNFGMSRYRFAEYFIVDILERNFDKILFEKIIKLYSKKSYELYLKAAFTKNLLEFLEKYKHKNLFIASGGDEKELNEIFKRRKIDKYFRTIYGSPKKKNDIVKEIVEEYNNSVMIGDAKSDMLAAKEAGIYFIFMREYSTNKKIEKKYNLKSINHLGDLI